MNQRLISLMKEAGFIFWEDEDWKPEDAVIDWATNYDKEIEKFAELIIQQCAYIAGGYFGPGRNPQQAIKEYFGVKNE